MAHVDSAEYILEIFDVTSLAISARSNMVIRYDQRNDKSSKLNTQVRCYQFLGYPMEFCQFGTTSIRGLVSLDVTCPNNPMA
jgi:hypothetical protein